MSLKKRLEVFVQGWLPKEPGLVYASKASKPRWRKPTWIALTLVALIGLSFVTYAGVQTYIRYSNPQADVTASYFEKSLNCSKAKVGDVIEVNVLLGWHGYVIPEFKRQVEIIDPLPESNFELVSGNNTCQYSGYGGGDQFQYLLKVIGGNAEFLELPKPRLYLDGSEIPLKGASAVLEIEAISELEN